MRTQVEPRFRKRVPCRLRAGGTTYSGMVLNLSRNGLFVQTGAKGGPGDEIQLDLSLAPESDDVALAARVVWRRIVKAEMRAVTAGGLGVQIECAPESYYRFLSGVAASTHPELRSTPRGQTAASPEPQPSQDGPRFRIRIRELGRPRTRQLVVRGESEADVRAQALRDLGKGWEILQVERLPGPTA